MLDTENKVTEKPMSINGTRDYKLEVELLRRDFDSMSKLYERLDTSIDKMEDVAKEFSQILFKQEHKFQYQDTKNKEIETSLEKHIKESEDTNKELNQKIERVDNKLHDINVELTQKILQSQTEIVEEMLRGRKELTQEFSKITESVNKKINDIDMWRYMVMGGIAFLVFVIGNISGITTIFTKCYRDWKQIGRAHV